MNTLPEYTLIRSDRKSLSVEVRQDASVVVRAPRRLAKARIEEFVRSRAGWIEEHREKMRLRALSPTRAPLTEDEIRVLYEKAATVLPEKVRYWSALMGVTPTGIRITGAEKRFGSCSGRNSLCFSYRLMRFPEEAIDYVVVHELAHIRHHDHSGNFYAFVARFLPDYKRREAMLKN